ncbi:MAG: hypothetical protein WAJ93_06570 [Candidatus Nitrosopolaris sp.]|jgi:hypothetical protein
MPSAKITRTTVEMKVTTTSESDEYPSTTHYGNNFTVVTFVWLLIHLVFRRSFIIHINTIREQKGDRLVNPYFKLRKRSHMVLEIGFSDMLSLAQTIGIVGTMVLTLYFSKRQIQSLSKSSWRLDEKFHEMVQLMMEDPSMQRVIDSYENPTRELTFSIYVLWICSQAHAMRQRRLLDDNEWSGWLQWMRRCFRKGTIKETWKQIELDKWFNPAFQQFINTEVATGSS